MSDLSGLSGWNPSRYARSLLRETAVPGGISRGEKYVAEVFADRLLSECHLDQRFESARVVGLAYAIAGLSTSAPRFTDLHQCLVRSDDYMLLHGRERPLVVCNSTTTYMTYSALGRLFRREATKEIVFTNYHELSDVEACAMMAAVICWRASRAATIKVDFPKWEWVQEA